LNSEHIMARFQLSPTAAPDQGIDNSKKRASAVMLPLIDVDDHAHILLWSR